MSSASSRDKSREGRYKDRFQRDQRKIRELQETLEAAIKSNEDLADAADERDQLVALVHEGAARVAFDDAAVTLGIDPEYLDDLWTVAPFAAGGDGDVDPKAVRKHVAEALKARPKLLKPADDQAGDDADGDAEDDDDDAEPDAPADKKGRVSALDLAPAKKAGKGKAGDADDDGGDGDAAAPKAGKARAADPAGKLGKGLGTGRGGRADQRAPTIDDVVDAEFAETGRTDPFRI